MTKTPKVARRAEANAVQIQRGFIGGGQLYLDAADRIIIGPLNGNIFGTAITTHAPKPLGKNLWRIEKSVAVNMWLYAYIDRTAEVHLDTFQPVDSIVDVEGSVHPNRDEMYLGCVYMDAAGSPIMVSGKDDTPWEKRVFGDNVKVLGAFDVAGAASFTSATFSGNVGIGTASPMAQLDVHQETLDTPALFLSRYNSENVAILEIGELAAAGGVAGTYGGAMLHAANRGIAFSTENNSTFGDVTTIDMFIKQGGNVGIGNASPSYKLDVNGDIQVNQAIHGVAGLELHAPNNIFARIDQSDAGGKYFAVRQGTADTEIFRIDGDTGVVSAAVGGFSGALTGNVTGNVTGSSGSCTGNAATATKILNIPTSFSGTYGVVVNVSGTLYSHNSITYTGATGVLTAGTFSGALSGNATTATTAGTVTTADQPAITSVGTLTNLDVDSININGTAITGLTSITCAEFRGTSAQDYSRLWVWGSSTYAIGMYSAQTYGYLTDYAMTFMMSNTATRGWIWKYDTNAANGSASLTVDGRFVVKNLIATSSGTVALPSHTFHTDPDTGMYRYAANEIGFSTAGTARLVITTTGIEPAYGSNYYLGGPSNEWWYGYIDYQYAAGGSAGYPTHSFKDDKNTGMYRISADHLGFATGGTNRVTIDNTGIEILTGGSEFYNPSNDVSAGTLKMIPTADRNGTLYTPTTPDDTWRTADLGSDVPSGVKALLIYITIQSTDPKDVMILLTREYGSTETSLTKTRTIRWGAQPGAGSALLGGVMTILCDTSGRFQYRRYSSNYPFADIIMCVHGYYI